MSPKLQDLERRIEAAKIKHGVTSATLAETRNMQQLLEFQTALSATAVIMAKACEKTAKALSEGPHIGDQLRDFCAHKTPFFLIQTFKDGQ